jgi:hypothetical protein
LAIPDALEEVAMDERRRCERFPLTIPVKVYGRTPRNHPFRDVTASMAVSLYGGLLDMEPRVKLGQKVTIVNSFTEEERESRVVYIDSKRRGRRKVAVEFASGAGDFWHVYGPRVLLKAVPSSPNVAVTNAPVNA